METLTRSNLAARPLQLSVIVPVLNERANILPLLEKLERCLDGIAWECIIVDDDSPDGTADLARQLARQRANVRVLQRVGRRGLASAVSEGIMASHAPFAAVIDGDMQHDEGILPSMLQALTTEDLDLAIGSRHVADGSSRSMTPLRQAMSDAAATLSRVVLKSDLSDPMSGFFMIRTDRFRDLSRNLSNTGFKILLDILLSAPEPLRYRELPYCFRERVHGDSKLGAGVMLEYLELLVDKKFGGLLPIRFMKFAMIGFTGVLLHMSIIAVLYRAAEVPFDTAQVTATVTAMISNFVLNNLITYRDRQLKGRGFWLGLLTFCAACSVGMIANLQIAALILQYSTSWILAALGGLIVSSVWNYGVTSVFTWRRKLHIRKRRAAPPYPQTEAEQEPSI